MPPCAQAQGVIGFELLGSEIRKLAFVFLSLYVARRKCQPLNSVIARSGPSVTIISSACATRLKTRLSSSSSCARNFVRIKFMTTFFPSGLRVSPEAVEGETPIRMRVNLFVLSVRMTDSNPLCPPLPRSNDILNFPMGRSKSSYITISRSADFADFTNFTTAEPDLFIKVSGSMTATVVLPIIPPTARDFDCLCSRQPSKCMIFAKNSAAIRPALCRVDIYFSPGLPKPAITHTIFGTSYHAYAIKYQYQAVNRCTGFWLLGSEMQMSTFSFHSPYVASKYLKTHTHQKI